MSNRQSVDLELFQTFLANAFAVQESGLDRRSLSALIEIQRFVAGDEFKLDAAMQMIVDRALGVAHASGVAIGMLEPNRNELVYRAGSGNAAKDVGRRVPAVLSASTAPEMRREILRVENAASDKRIEAEICRQFGAMSLVMLPIYKEHVLVGVLQALFEGSHSFPEREIRAYRLMIGALEESMLRSSPPAPKEAAAVAVASLSANSVSANVAYSPQLAEFAERVSEPSAVFAPRAEQSVSPKPSTDDAPVFWQPEESFSVYRAIVVRELAQLRIRLANAPESLSIYREIVIRQLAQLRSRFTNALAIAKIPPLSGNFRNAAAAIGGALVLSIVVWIAHRGGTANEKVSLSGSTSNDTQLKPSAKPTFVDETMKPVGDESKEASTSYRGFKRVRVGPDEVDYIADDVTIRKFEPIHPKPQVRNTGKEVNFGDDVTVRYFAKSPAVASQSSSGSEATPGKKSARSE
jgi:hypothetical protein